jgi:hypothetical protein
LELIIEINKEYTHIHRKGILKMEKNTRDTREQRDKVRSEITVRDNECRF